MPTYILEHDKDGWKATRRDDDGKQTDEAPGGESLPCGLLQLRRLMAQDDEQPQQKAA